MRKTILVLAAALLASASAYADAWAQRYAVTITNVTVGQTFTPLLVVTHKPSVSLFKLGEPASPELGLIAEAGDIGPTCGGEAVSAADGEGYVHISRGIHGVGDLPSVDYDWRNPVAVIRVRRVHNYDD